MLDKIGAHCKDHSGRGKRSHPMSHRFRANHFDVKLGPTSAADYRESSFTESFRDPDVTFVRDPAPYKNASLVEVRSLHAVDPTVLGSTETSDKFIDHRAPREPRVRCGSKSNVQIDMPHLQQPKNEIYRSATHREHCRDKLDEELNRKPHVVIPRGTKWPPDDRKGANLVTGGPWAGSGGGAGGRGIHPLPRYEPGVGYDIFGYAKCGFQRETWDKPGVRPGVKLEGVCSRDPITDVDRNVQRPPRPAREVLYRGELQSCPQLRAANADLV